MKDLKKAAIASFSVQVALAIVGLTLSFLPAQLGQSGVIALFPFVLGVQVGPMLLRPLVISAGDFSFDLMMVVMASSLVSNFIVYATIFYAWFTLRKKLFRSPLALA